MPTSFEKTAEDLLRMLAGRHDDPAFWTPLTGVLREIVQAAVASPPRSAALPPGAQLLAAWDVEELAQRLRDALPQPGAQVPDLARPDRMIAPGEPFPSALLGALLVLGLAVAACDSPLDTSRTGGSDAGAMAGGSAGHGGAAATTGGASANGGSGGQALAGGAGGAASTGCAPDVQSGLWTAIDGSALSAADKQTLHSCLVNLKASWCEGLTQLFATGTQEQIASTLGELVSCCNQGRPRLDQEWSQAYQALLNGVLCPVVVYKGVSFPD
jgi:hypothetical protein